MTDESFPSLYRGLEVNRTLNELIISGNEFSPEAIQSLLKYLPNTKIGNIVMKVNTTFLLRIFD
jgi:Ran GTPase-activating protein (RanGAP) involved in mRNA processing and transport